MKSRLQQIIRQTRTFAELQQKQLQPEAVPGRAGLQMAGLIDLAGDGVAVYEFTTGASSRFIGANPALCTLLGYTGNEMRCLSPRDIVVTEDTAVLSENTRILRTQGTLRHEKTLIAKNGRRIPVEITARLFQQRDRLMVLAVVRDISLRKSIETSLRESEAGYRNLVESSPDAILVHCEGRYVYANRAAAKIFRTDDQERLVGLSVLETVHPESRDCIRQRMQYVAESGKATPVREVKMLGLDGSVVEVEATGSPVTYRGMRATQVVMHDIGARKQAERQRLLAEEELRCIHEELEQRVTERTAELATALKDLRDKEHMLLQQSRLAAMGEMINNIAHQWRQPLNSLGLNIQQLGLSYGTSHFSQELLDKAVDSSMMLIQHMSQTIDDFRNFFKTEKEMIHFRTSLVIANSISLIIGSFNHHQIAIDMECDDDPLIYGYLNEYSQVLLNILMNARDAFKARPEANRRVLISTCLKGDKAIMTIRDNAGGIPAGIMDRIFDPYFTTKGPTGTGIGLFMAKNIIETNMHGSLSVRNTGNGAEFTIEI